MADAAALIARYAVRWSIEQGLGRRPHRSRSRQEAARNRTHRAVERAVPFALLTCTLVMTWAKITGVR